MFVGTLFVGETTVCCGIASDQDAALAAMRGVGRMLLETGEADWKKQAAGRGAAGVAAVEDDPRSFDEPAEKPADKREAFDAKRRADQKLWLKNAAPWPGPPPAGGRRPRTRRTS